MINTELKRLEYLICSVRSKLLYLIVLFIGIVIGYKFCTITTAKDIEICFSPQQRCEKQIINHIRNAKHKIFIHSYSLTSQKIISELIKANNRKVKVKLLVDSSQIDAPYSKIKQLISYDKIDTRIDQTEGLAHNKIMIIDDNLLITGSYNWTNSANYKNAENILFIMDQSVVKEYINNWNYRYQYSKKS